MVFDISWITRAFRDVNRRIDQLTPSIAKSFLPVTETITETVIATVEANYSTTAEMNAAIANPGAISPTSVSVSGDVTASGRVYSAAPVQSPGSYALQVGGQNYVSAWIQADGQIGFSPSTRDSKKDLEPLTDTTDLLSLVPQLGRYLTDDESSPLRQFLIAEEVQEAGFGPDVAPLDADGKAFTVNYSQLVPALLAEVKALRARVDAAGL